MATINTFWIKVQFAGSKGKIIAYVPGLAQATAIDHDSAFKAVIDQLKERVLSIDVHAYKLLLRK